MNNHLSTCRLWMAGIISLLYLNALAWDYEGHRMVNQVGLASLPTNFPAFTKTAEAQERIAFLAGEPDRWRNTSELPLKHFNGPDHYIDLDDLPDYGLSASNLSSFRYEFAAQLAVARALHPTNFAPINAAKNEDKTRELVGFLPWTIEEYYAKLKSAFSYLKTFEAEGTPEEVSNAQQNVINLMGTMGHFVGDAGQPLHSTKHFNGWVGENPKHYATNNTFHGWVDGGYINRAGIHFEEMKRGVRVAKVLPEAEHAQKELGMFPVALQFIIEQNKLVEPLYQLNQDKSLSDHGEPGSKGRAFLVGQIMKSGQFLGDLWVSAWKTAPMDTYLKGKLINRKLNGAKKPGKE